MMVNQMITNNDAETLDYIDNQLTKATSEDRIMYLWESRQAILEHIKDELAHKERYFLAMTQHISEESLPQTIAQISLGYTILNKYEILENDDDKTD